MAKGEVREDLPDDRRIVQRGDQAEPASTLGTRTRPRTGRPRRQRGLMLAMLYALTPPLTTSLSREHHDRERWIRPRGIWRWAGAAEQDSRDAV